MSIKCFIGDLDSIDCCLAVYFCYCSLWCLYAFIYSCIFSLSLALLFSLPLHPPHIPLPPLPPSF